MVTIKDGCGCGTTSCCSWKDKLEEAYKRATASVNKIGDDSGNVYFPDGTGYVKVPLPTKEQIDNIAQIDGIKASVDELNKTVPALETQVTGVTESLVSNVEVLNGTTAGKFKVRIEREKAALIDSNDYDLSKVNSVELIQGSGPAMVKAQLTLSDGTVLRSDDFLFTTESIGTDVYISSFTFKAGNVDGTISADIGLNNGTTLEANNFVVPTDPAVVSTITDLQTRMSAVESGSSVTGLDELKVTVNTHTSEIAQLTNDVGNLMTSKVNVAQGTENAGKALVVGEDGNVTVGSAGGAATKKYPITSIDELKSFNFEVGDIVIFDNFTFSDYNISNFSGFVHIVSSEYVIIYGKWLSSRLRKYNSNESQYYNSGAYNICGFIKFYLPKFNDGTEGWVAVLENCYGWNANNENKSYPDYAYNTYGIWQSSGSNTSRFTSFYILK